MIQEMGFKFLHVYFHGANAFSEFGLKYIMNIYLIRVFEFLDHFGLYRFGLGVVQGQLALAHVLVDIHLLHLFN